MATAILIALHVVLSIFALQKLVRYVQSPLWKIPGPWYARLTNLPLKWATVTGRRIYFIDALHRKYGDIVLIAPNEVDCSDPTMFRDIHRHGNGFRKAEWYQTFSGYVDVDENHSLFAMLDPKIHATRRKLLARPFSKTEIRTHWEAEIRRTVEFAVERMNDDAKAHPAGEVDCQKWWVLMAADVSSKITFGESFGLLQAGEKNTYLTAVERAAKANGILAELPLLAYLPLPSLRALLRAPQTAMTLASTTVATARSSTQSTNIFAPVLAAAEKENTHLSPTVLAREARSLIIAGSDTTAITLTYLVWCVLERLGLHADLVGELVGELEAAGGGFVDERLEALPLLNAVIRETLRLYGAAPGSLPRRPPRGGAVVGGWRVGEETVVSTQAWSLHRHPEIWERPEEFDVRRWLPGGEVSEKARAAFNPFGGGARVCLGMHIAEMEMRYAVALFFTRYPNARLAPGTTAETMVPEHFFIINPKARMCRIILS